MLSAPLSAYNPSNHSRSPRVGIASQPVTPASAVSA